MDVCCEDMLLWRAGGIKASTTEETERCSSHM